MLMDALHAALEQAEEAFNRVGRHVAARVLAGRVLRRLVGRMPLADSRVKLVFVCVETAAAAGVAPEHVARILGRHDWHVLHADSRHARPKRQ